MEPLVRFDLRHGVAHVTVIHPMPSTLGLPAMRGDQAGSSEPPHWA